MTSPRHEIAILKACTALAWIGLLSAIDQTVAAAPGDEIYAKPGRLIAADGTRLNFHCSGSGSPAVVFDSGWRIAALRECRAAVASGRSLPLLPAAPGEAQRTCAQQFFRGLPEAELQLNRNAPAFGPSPPRYLPCERRFCKTMSAVPDLHDDWRNRPHDPGRVTWPFAASMQSCWPRLPRA